MIGIHTSRTSPRSALVVNDGSGWLGIGWYDWTNLGLIRARLDAGADPNSGADFPTRPLHAAAEEILTTYLYQSHAAAYCYASASLRPADARSITGPPDMWLRLPDQDWWI